MRKPPCQLDIVYAIKTTESRAKRQYYAIKTLGSLGCCPFLGEGCVIVDSSLYVPPILCWGSVSSHWFVIHNVMSFIVL